MSQYLELLDWRRLVASLYAEVRSRPHCQQTAEWFRDQRDQMFREHPQSPIPANARAAFRSLSYWEWNPLGRVPAQFKPITQSQQRSMNDSSGEARLLPIGTVSFELSGRACNLNVLWVDAYGGGVFVPFRDATSGTETYGGGRYLIDTIKGVDLGSSYQDGTLTLDFNYAYHPSCAYDPMWPCPLAPPENWLPMAVRLGERLEQGRADELC
jgi:hypothetical protein